MLVLFLLGVVICAYALLMWREHWRKTHAHALPPVYPGALPFIGHAYMLLGSNEKILETLQSVATECVKQGGVLLYFVGRDLYYIITNPEDAVTASNVCLQKHFAYQYAKSWLGDGLITGSGEVWKRHRRLLSPTYSLPVVNGFIDIFNSQSRRLISIVEPHAGKGPFVPYTYLKTISMEAFCLTAFGIDGVANDFMQKYMKAADELLHRLTNRFYNFYLHSDLIYKLSGLKKKEADAISMMNSLSYEIIRKKKSTMKNLQIETEIQGSAKYRPILDLLLSMDDVLTEKEIKEEVDTAIVTGFDTTSTALLYITMLLGHYPEVQEKVYKELIDILGPDNDVEKEDLSKLVYTEAVIKETLRYITGAPVLLRYVHKDVKLKNYTMRAGSQCVIMPLATHRDLSWGSDNQYFRPERWLDGSPIPEKAFGGFAWGKRSCLGKTFALTTMKVTIAHFIRRYRLKADMSKLKLKMDFIVKPLSGHEISIEKRN